MPPSATPSASPGSTPGPSRRPPSKLRVPTSLRKASNPSLSLVHASSGSSLPPVPASSSSSSSTSRSEEALSRQLDADLGGKQMGLRSRRSSSATIRTINTINGGGGPQSPRESIAEEEEDSGPMLEREVEVDRRSTRLNPKASSSWLRWNSPTPSFPRSTKGKEREGDTTPVRRGSTVGGSSIRRQASRRSELPTEEDGQAATTDRVSDTPRLPPELPQQSSPTSSVPPDSQPSAAESPPIPSPTTTTATSRTPQVATGKARGWFSRNPPPATALPEPSPEAAQGEEAVASERSEHETRSKAQDLGRGEDAVPASETPTTSAAQPPLAPAGDGVPEPEPVSAPSTGWTSYLSWGRSRAPPAETQTKSSEPDSAPAPVADPSTDTHNHVDHTDGRPDCRANSIDLTVGTEQPSGVITETAASPGDQGLSNNAHESAAPDVKQTWGTFFYNIVIPQVRDIPLEEPARASGDEQVVKPVSPTCEQTLLHIEPDVIPTGNRLEEPLSAEPPTGQPDASHPLKEAASGPTRVRKGSQASTNGWLSYLAFRASQKKVEAPNSIATAGTGEEVMDLSNDPNFPSGADGQKFENGSTPLPTKVPSKDGNGAMRPPSTIPMRDKRPSNSSLRSAASVTPIPPSPRKPGNTTPAPSIKAGPSTLPPPPQPAPQQPNLVIPTFSSTFDRPPRCFLPAQSEKAPTAPPQAPSGLAWRALGAVGSYVYSGASQVPKKQEEHLQGDAKETRGRKEGRNVGGHLPRRLGLNGDHPEDGWRHVKRVVVVGVHGWFPAKMLNSVIGEPTGTSTKFANMMGQAVKRFFDDKGVDDIRLTMIPLEGEGTIENRVDRLYKSYLSNPAWINDLRRADAIFFAAHSQGCIVTTHLLSLLIAQGHIKTPLNAEAVARCSWAFGPVSIIPSSEPRTPRSHRAATVPVTIEEGGYQKVCMLAMCGVHQGPFYSLGTSTVIQPYLQWFENAAARELFEFQDTTSAVAQAYQKHLAVVLEHNVRVILLSSLNDQVVSLVPIYGSSFSAATHPLLLRALFVDGASYTASDFMTNLLCFAFMLRNAGISDEHLIEHLSEATAGSLTGLGHSTPYEEPATFRLAVDYLFYSGPAADPMPELKVDHFAAREGRNDFELPWIMRALVDSPEVKDLFPGELRDLKEGILHWKPTTKALRDIKKRLEPMAGRQSRLRPLPQSPSSGSLNTGAPELGASPGSNKHITPSSGLRQDW